MHTLQMLIQKWVKRLKVADFKPYLINIEWFDQHFLHCDYFAVTHPFLQLISLNTKKFSRNTKMDIFVLKAEWHHGNLGPMITICFMGNTLAYDYNSQLTYSYDFETSPIKFKGTNDLVSGELWCWAGGKWNAKIWYQKVAKGQITMLWRL